MKLNVFVALAALAFGSSLVLAAPLDFDSQDLTARDTYEVEDFVARYLADVDQINTREDIDEEEFEARADELENFIARSPRVLRSPRLSTLPSRLAALHFAHAPQFRPRFPYPGRYRQS